MADNVDQSGKSALAQSASRLDSIVQSVRAQQTGECRGTHCVTEYTVSSHSPDEVWAKNFATYGIGPQMDTQSFAASVPPVTAPKPAAEASRPMQTAEHAPMVQFHKPRERKSVLRAILFGNRA
jgi:hypothetical protein